ncbi:MAG: phosphate ABC transporter substrate-binding protein [candidate division Zixibacteria bacterium]|nr:phosphate ABC transporter substrate-binding protein [candidate division Zixibacteria bacterium]
MDRMRITLRGYAAVLTALFVFVSIGGFFGLTLAAERPKPVSIKGSDTMVQLVSSWAEAFMNKYPEADISVTGGGSGTGIAALLNGTTDICSASRDMKEKEIADARAKGIEPTRNVVARDGIAVIVNPANPISELTQEQIAKIYTGAYTNWTQLGGPDHKIIVLSRESSSVTYVFFQEHVLKLKDYTVEARLMPATSAIVQSVGADKWAIGYVGLGYAVESKGKVKMLAVKADADAPAVVPSEATVISGTYSIARGLYLYTKGTPEGQIKNFIDFCLSPEGQKIAVETGYVPVK